MSVSIFLSYADLGFLGAGQKYAAEEYARGNLEVERRILGFCGFVLLVFVLICAAGFMFLSVSPQSIIKDISGHERDVATSLFMILALAAPITVIQRITQMIYSVRIEDYIFQRFMIVASVVKIGSVFFFFRSGHYEIVNYYAFVQCANLAASLCALVVAERRYKYGIGRLFRSIRFDPALFAKTKDLAFSSLFLTLSWILYYECDNFVIGHVIGAEAVAVYAIGLTLMSFLRSLLGSVFSPFTSRFNHYIGLHDEDGLKHSLSLVLSLTIGPIVLFVTTILILMKPLVFTWVGPTYAGAIVIAQLLLACNIFASVYYPGSILLVAKERVRLLYGLGAVLPLIYWGGIVVAYKALGLEAFGLFKLVAFSVTSMVYLFVILKYLGLSIGQFLERYVARILPALAILVISLLALRGFLPLVRSKTGLLLVIGCGGLVALPCISLSLFLNPDGRYFLKTALEHVRERRENRKETTCRQ